jgi:hypothetical protein
LPSFPLVQVTDRLGDFEADLLGDFEADLLVGATRGRLAGDLEAERLDTFRLKLTFLGDFDADLFGDREVDLLDVFLPIDVILYL